MKKTFKLAEFFSGPGGMGKGASISKVKDKKNTYSIEHAWASDYDQDSCNTYKRNIKPKAVFCEKVESFFSLVDKKKIILPKFDCFAYGFPCNDFSNVGEHLGSGSGDLFGVLRETNNATWLATISNCFRKLHQYNTIKWTIYFS